MQAGWQTPEDPKSPKGTDRTGTLISLVVAVAAVGTLAVNILQTNSSTEVRALSLAVVLVLVVILLFGVGYSPLRRTLQERRVKRTVDEVAVKNLPRLLELANRFRILTSPGHPDSIANVLFTIRTAGPFAKARYQNIYFNDQMMTSIERLSDEPMSWRLFYQLVRLLDTMISNFTNEAQGAVAEIKSVQAYGTFLTPVQLEAYNLTRTYFINFLTSWREFGDKLDNETGARKSSGMVRSSPYSVPVSNFTPPGEL
jgi:hypothetical protein